MFITFEGIEGCGKTTQISLLAETLIRQGLACFATREPGGTAIGEAIRGIFLHCANDDMLPVTELLLVTAARAQHVERVIKPRLRSGAIVLCDRFIDATVAYQGCASGLGRDMVMRCHDLFVGSLMPDVTLLLDCPVEIGLARSRERNRAAGKDLDEGRFEERGRAFHEQVRAGYLEQARREPARFEIIPAEGRPGDIHRHVAESVLRRMRGAGHAV
jgi:dTMP kinase